MLTVPADLSFEGAIALTQEFLTQLDSLDTAAVTPFVRQLNGTMNGARGFFVIYLTADSPIADQQRPEILAGLTDLPETVDELLVKNLAMSTATALTHERQDNADMAASSQRVAQRSAAHLQALTSDSIRSRLAQLQASLEGDGPYADFLSRWGYDTEQRQAIGAAIAPLLNTV